MKEDGVEVERHFLVAIILFSLKDGNVLSIHRQKNKSLAKSADAGVGKEILKEAEVINDFKYLFLSPLKAVVLTVF